MIRKTEILQNGFVERFVIKIYLQMRCNLLVRKKCFESTKFSRKIQITYLLQQQILQIQTKAG